MRVVFRLPEAREHRHVRPIVSPLYQYLVAVGGDPGTAVDLAVPDIYDAAAWRTLARQPPFPRAPKSMVFVGPMILLADNAGATWLDLSTDATKTVTAASLPFGEVAGGLGLAVTDGARFIVGALVLPDRISVLQGDLVRGSICKAASTSRWASSHRPMFIMATPCW